MLLTKNEAWVINTYERYKDKQLELLFVIEKVPVGGYCKQNEQCEGSENNTRECLLGRCVCKAGYVLSNLECHGGKLKMLYKITYSHV